MPDDNHPDNKKCEFEGWADIREKKRSSTDVLFILLLFFAWIAMTIIGLISVGAISSTTLTKGNPYRLVNSIDYNGSICGYDSAVRDLKYGYYLPDKTVVCVSGCPEITDYTKFICQYDLQSDVDNDNTKLKGLKYFSKMQCMYNVKTSIGKKFSLIHRFLNWLYFMSVNEFTK